MLLHVHHTELVLFGRKNGFGEGMQGVLGVWFQFRGEAQLSQQGGIKHPHTQTTYPCPHDEN